MEMNVILNQAPVSNMSIVASWASKEEKGVQEVWEDFRAVGSR